MKLRDGLNRFGIIYLGSCRTHRVMKAEASSYDAVGVLAPLWYSELAEVPLDDWARRFVLQQASPLAGLSMRVLFSEGALSDSELVGELSTKEHNESLSSAEDRSPSELGCPVKSERVDGRERASRRGWCRTMKSVSLRELCDHTIPSSSIEN